MLNGNKFRLYPEKKHQKVLFQWQGCQKFIYNAKVKEERYFRKFKSRFVEHANVAIPLDQKYSQFKTEQTPWLKQVPSQILRNGSVRFIQAYSRFHKGLAGRPKIKKPHHKKTLWLTKELFTIKTHKDSQYDTLIIGTKRFPVGEMRFLKHHNYDSTPDSIVISCEGTHWFVSFATEDNVPQIGRNDIGEHLEKMDEKDLNTITIGIDRNTVHDNQVALSNGHSYSLLKIEQERIQKKTIKNKRYQRRMAQQKKGSCSYRKNQQKVQKNNRYMSNVRKDFAHKTSFNIINDPRTQIVGLEKLALQNMTKKPKPKKHPDKPGVFLPNKAKAKAGLNKSILGASMGMLRTFLRYKAAKNQKLIVEVSAHYSSQECAHCGYIHPDNRETQSRFICQACGHESNADHNASINVKHRTVKNILSGNWREKSSKKTLQLNKGRGGSLQSSANAENADGEQVSLVCGNTDKLSSLKSETHTLVE